MAAPVVAPVAWQWSPEVVALAAGHEVQAYPARLISTDVRVERWMARPSKKDPQ